MPMWAQTYGNGHRYYREQYGSRSVGACVEKSSSFPCEVPDEQVGRLIEAILLPEAWIERVLAQIHVAGEAERVGKEQAQVQGHLKRLANAYIDGLVAEEDYCREKQQLQDRLVSLVVPGVDVAAEAGKLLEDLPKLWSQATVSEWHRLLLTMLEAVYVDAKEERRVVAIRPRPAFRALFELATAREGSGVLLIKEEPPGRDQRADPGLCFRWRRGGVDLHLKHDLAVLVAA